MSKKIEIEKNKLMEAYKTANDEQKELLVNLYGKEVFKPADIRERVKTIADACAVLGNHPYVNQYLRIIEEQTPPMDETAKDLVAYLKLRVICAALNEGWEPTFADDEYRWYPWFVVYTKEELDRMSEEKRRRVVGRSYSSAYASGGLVCASASNASSYSITYNGSRLAFKSEELADYAGKQFIEIYADFVGL